MEAGGEVHQENGTLHHLRISHPGELAQEQCVQTLLAMVLVVSVVRTQTQGNNDTLPVCTGLGLGLPLGEILSGDRATVHVHGRGGRRRALWDETWGKLEPGPGWGVR
eukprot:637703-Rhodomonas_salina.1